MTAEVEVQNQTVREPMEAEFTFFSKCLWLFIFYGIPSLAILSVAMAAVKSHSNSRVVIEIADRFILNNEISIPTAISFLLMVTASQLSALVYFVFQKLKKRKLNLIWVLLAFGMAAMAFDEVGQIHEKIPAPVLREYFLDHGWILAMLLPLLACAVLSVPFFLALPRDLARGLFTALATFFFGAIALEGIGGFYATKVEKNLLYDFFTVLEESTELLGIAYMNIVLFDFISRQRFILKFYHDASQE